MKPHALALGLFTTVAFADAPYDQIYRVRVLTGGGTDVHGTGFGALSAELGHSPFRGALSTGAGLASATAFSGEWSVVTPYVYGRFDWVYPILTRLWSRPPIPPRIIILDRLRSSVGVRLGADISESFRTKVFTAEPSYVLARPSTQPFFDAEIALDDERDFSLVFRASIDLPLSLDAVLRWNVMAGLAYCWGGTY